MDVGINSREFSSDCYNKIVSKEGKSGLYRGLSLSLTGIFVYRALYFGLLDVAKHFLRTYDMQRNVFIVFAAA